MVHPAIIGICAAVGGALISQQVSLIASEDKYWWDIYHKYFIFPEEYTDLIDDLLSDPNYGKMSQVRVVSRRKRIPGEGLHYYYIFHARERGFFSISKRLRRITLEKIKEELDDREIYYYRASISPCSWGTESLESFEERILRPQTNTVRVISIDLATHIPRTMFLTKICKPPKQNQIEAMQLILAQWNQAQDFNVKVMISGRRGLGKSYTAMVLKKEIERNNPDMYARLYDDFDPTAIGVNIKSIALRYANPKTPIILVINEIDLIYQGAIENRENYDPREQHTRNKQSFNNMLDAIAATPYVILVMTTEKSPAQLYDNQNFRSFMRKGRVDLFLKMDEENSSVLNPGE